MKHLVLALTATLLACEQGGTAQPPSRWPCPLAWTPAPHGGCMPRAVRCADPNVRNVDCTRAPTEVRRRADRGFDGPWPRDGAPGAPPAIDWEPAGVPAADASPDVSWSSCPTGWAPAADGTCDPQLPATCPAGDGALPGGRCTETHACPAGEFADAGALPPGASLLHVRAGASDTGADGSAQRPFATLGAALQRSRGRAWILVAQGRYDEPLTVRGEVHVLGACAGRVTLVGGDDAPAVAVEGTSGALELRGVTVSGGRFGVAASGGASVTLRGVRVEGALGPCVRAEGSATRLELRDVVVRACRPLPDNTSGAGVYVGPGASADLARVHLAELTWRGVASSGARVTLEDSLVRDVRMGYQTTNTAGASPWTAYGLFANAGGSLTARRVAVERSSNQGASAGGAGTSLTLEDVRVTDVRRRGGEGLDQPEACLSATDGARLNATRVGLLRCTDVGVRATLRGHVTLREAVVREVARTDATGLRSGVGLLTAFGGALTGERVRVELATTAGVEASDADATLTLRGAIVRETRPNPALSGSPLGVGAVAVRGGRVELTEARIDGCRLFAAGAMGAGSSMTVTGSLLRATLPNPAARIGAAGVAARDGATVLVRRSRITDNFGAGFGVDDGLSGYDDTTQPGAPASLTLEDSVVARTTALANVAGTAFDYAGQGGSVTRGSRATLTRTVLADNGRLGLVVGDPGSACSLTDVVVRGTGREQRPDDTRPTFALLARDGATLTALRVRVQDNRVHVAVTVGLQGAQGTLTDSVVRGTTTPGNVFGGQGAQVNDDGSLTLERTLVEGNGLVAASAHRRAHLSLRESALVDTRAGVDPDVRGVAIGLLAGTDGVVEARGVLVAGSGMVGVWAADRSRVTADDVIVWGVTPALDGGRRMFGHGLLAHTGAVVEADRLAVVDVHGVGLGAVSTSLDARTSSPARITARDVFVRGVASAEVRASEVRGSETSYGLHAAAGSSFTADRVTVEQSDWGFFLSGGALTLRAAAFALHPRGLGCQNGAPADSPLRLEGVSTLDAGPLARDLELPVALLPSPPAP